MFRALSRRRRPMRQTVVIEVRGASGGEEAALFAEDLVRMYRRYGERRGWKVEATSGVLMLTGDDAYETLKTEAGVHCIQRIPPGKRSSGKVHTSTATVAVLRDPGGASRS